jgi:GNAT superfamily N-acetyltransferase
MSIEVRPATRERWGDLVDLFERPGPRGRVPVTASCWCMAWRVSTADFKLGWGNGETLGVLNRARLQDVVADGRVPGVLAYDHGKAVGWCSIAPRSEFIRLEKSRALTRLDDQPVWSVVCFYVDLQHKRQGLGTTLLTGAIEFASSQGAQIVEAYASRPGDHDPFTGFESMFSAAGFSMMRDDGGRRSIWRLNLHA